MEMQDTRNSEAILVKWIEEERRKGMIDMKFYPTCNEDATLTSFCAEVSQILTGEDVEDEKFF